MATIIRKKASKKWNKLKELMDSEVSVRVGIMGNSALESKLNDRNSKAKFNEGITVAQIASYHEFGLGVPRRSFLRDYFDQEIRQIMKIVSDAINVVAKRDLHAYVVGEYIGALVKSGIQTRIDRHIPPPLHPETVRRKGSSTPLVNTGQLKSSVTYISQTLKKVIP